MFKPILLQIQHTLITFMPQLSFFLQTQLLTSQDIYWLKSCGLIIILMFLSAAWTKKNICIGSIVEQVM